MSKEVELNNKYHLSQLTDYTMGETCVGKWVDGKEIWRKVVKLNAKDMNQYGVIPYDFTNIKDLIKSNLMASTQEGIWLKLDYLIGKNCIQIEEISNDLKLTLILEYTVE